MEAIILAGGKGSRLQTVVHDRPKPLALVGRHPFLSHLFDYLLRQGVTHLVLSVGYKCDHIINYYGSSYKGVPISYAVENEPLLTGGAIKNSESFLLEEEPVVVVNGDTYCPIDLKAAVEKFKSYKADVLIPVKYVADTSRYGTIKFDKGDRILNFIEKHGGHGYINVGSYIIDRNLIKNFSNRIFSFEKDFLEKTCDKQRFFVLPIKNFFIDIGVPRDYFRACEIFNNGQIKNEFSET